MKQVGFCPSPLKFHNILAISIKSSCDIIHVYVFLRRQTITLTESLALCHATQSKKKSSDDVIW